MLCRHLNTPAKSLAAGKGLLHEAWPSGSDSHLPGKTHSQSSPEGQWKNMESQGLSVLSWEKWTTQQESQHMQKIVPPRMLRQSAVAHIKAANLLWSPQWLLRCLPEVFSWRNREKSGQWLTLCHCLCSRMLGDAAGCVTTTGIMMRPEAASQWHPETQVSLKVARADEEKRELTKVQATSQV